MDVKVAKGPKKEKKYWYKGLKMSWDKNKDWWWNCTTIKCLDWRAEIKWKSVNVGESDYQSLFFDINFFI